MAEENKVALVYAGLYADDLIDEGEYLLLVEECEDKAPVFQYWKYNRLRLEEMTDDECISKFRFKREDIPRHVRALRLPEKFVCPNGTIASSMWRLKLQ